MGNWGPVKALNHCKVGQPWRCVYIHTVDNLKLAVLSANSTTTPPWITPISNDHQTFNLYQLFILKIQAENLDITIGELLV